jgi:hypothetical protein
MPRPSSCNLGGDPSGCSVTSIDSARSPANASSTALSMISHRQCIRPSVSVDPMYMPGPLADGLETLQDQQVRRVVGVVDDGAHHAREHGDKLRQVAIRVHDETHKLAGQPES